MALDQIKLIDFPKVQDHRGNLSYVEEERHVPYAIRRVYYLYDVPGGAVRGGHAHRRLQQTIIALSGSFDVLVDDGVTQKSYHLNRSFQGLYLPCMTWRELDNFSSGSVCMVLASDYYQEEDYIRHYKDFLQELGLDVSEPRPQRRNSADF